MNVASPQAVSSRAFRFVLLVGVMSFFADFVYEGSRSIIGPYLAFLGAGALAVGVITGFGELLGGPISEARPWWRWDSPTSR